MSGESYAVRDLERRVAALEKLIPTFDEQRMHLEAHKEIEMRLYAIEARFDLSDVTPGDPDTAAEIEQQATKDGE